MALKRKWSDICRRLHSSSTSKPHTCGIPAPGVVLSLNGRQVTDSVSPCLLRKNSLPKPEIRTPIVLSGQTIGLELNEVPSASQPIIACTNLRLGTLYGSAVECTRILDKPIRRSDSSRSYEEVTLCQVSQSLFEKDLENSWTVLAQKVYWQMEAIQTISRTVSRCRNGNGNVWLSFVGPDKVGKRKIASGIAEIVFYRKENLLSLDLNSQDVISPFNSIVDCYYDSKCRRQLKSGRKMIVDYVAQELSKHPHSVVLLENVDKADFLVRDSLSRAIKTGKFPDSHGREIIINNNVFVLVTSPENLFFGKVVITSEFPEDKILKAKNLQMQILVGSSDGNYTRRNFSSTNNVSVTPSKVISKRKLSNNAEMSKRLSRSIIDLNLPVEEEEEGDNIVGSEKENDNLRVWLEELLEHVDENVVFKPFDFDSLSQKILKDIDARLKKATVWLEIDEVVILQILAAAWLTDRKNALDDWIQQVLCLTIEEARQRCNANNAVVMKLVPCDGFVVEAQAAAGLCLPATIINLN